ncbi:hypothetical protein PG988_007057 [Apiospora saccharicola]
MAPLLLVLLLLALFQDAIATKPHEIPPPFPFPHGNGTGIAKPTATGHRSPLISTTGIPHPPNGTSQSSSSSRFPQSRMIDDKNNQASYSPDCIYAAKWAPYTFVECLSEEKGGHLYYTITASGTGQEPMGWANAIYENSRDQGPCRGRYFLGWYSPTIDITNNATFNYVIDGWSRRIMELHGFTMAFEFAQWDSNNCHDVVKRAITAATCPGVYVANGLACRKKGYYGDNSLPPGSTTYNHPDIGDYDDNNAGPP